MQEIQKNSVGIKNPPAFSGIRKFFLASSLFVAGIMNPHAAKAQQSPVEMAAVRANSDSDTLVRQSGFANEAGIGYKLSLDSGRNSMLENRVSIAATHFSFYGVTAPSVSYFGILRPTITALENFRLLFGTTHTYISGFNAPSRDSRAVADGLQSNNLSGGQMLSTFHLAALYNLEERAWGTLGFGASYSWSIDYPLGIINGNYNDAYSQFSLGTALRLRKLSIFLTSDFLTASSELPYENKILGLSIFPLNVSLGSYAFLGKFFFGGKGTFDSVKPSVKAFAGYQLPKNFFASLGAQVDFQYPYHEPLPLAILSIAWSPKISGKVSINSIEAQSSPQFSRSGSFFEDNVNYSKSGTNTPIAQAVLASPTLASLAQNDKNLPVEERIQRGNMLSASMNRFNYSEETPYAGTEVLYNALRQSLMADGKLVPGGACFAISRSVSDYWGSSGIPSLVGSMTTMYGPHSAALAFEKGRVSMVDGWIRVSAKTLAGVMRQYSDFDKEYNGQSTGRVYMFVDLGNGKLKGRAKLPEMELLERQTGSSGNYIIEGLLLWER